jgi:hypothetical protein
MENNLGLHFLDIYHQSYCGTRPHWQGSDSGRYEYERRTPCAVVLSEAGIKFKKSDTDNIHDIDFQNGVLTMPLFGFGDETEMELLNLMAFEWLHPDAGGDVVEYIDFVDKIIESEKDVALLSSKGMFVNMSGSDKKAVQMFNTLTKLTGSINEDNRLGHVKGKVNAHCRKRRNKWRANFVNTYLSNPWVFISLVAAIVLLVATLLQTVYTIVPFYTKG